MRTILKLTHDNFIKAKDFIFANAEDIDRAWFRYVFEDKDEDAFLDVLAKYQYDNGGFGGLYYEFDYQGACLKSTEVAVKYILSLEKKPSADHPLIRKTINYLLDNYLPGIGNWCEVVVPAVNDGVHCHWVRYRGEDVTPIGDEDERIRAGGDMYDEHMKFLAWASEYDTGDITMRSKAKHDAWQTHLPCEVITVNGTESIEKILKTLNF